MLGEFFITMSIIVLLIALIDLYMLHQKNIHSFFKSIYQSVRKIKVKR
jgi:hypothetical protein